MRARRGVEQHDAVGAAADDALREHGAALADAVVEAIPRWIARSVGSYAAGVHTDDAARAAVADIGPRLRALLAADVDDQRENPLALLRDVARYGAEVLAAAGVPAPPRSRFDVEHFPDDPYGLVPMTWRDIDEALHEPGITWGAAKAMAHRRRHGP